MGSMPERRGRAGRRAKGAGFCAAAHFAAVPAWILGSRSAARRLPEDDEEEEAAAR